MPRASAPTWIAASYTVDVLARIGDLGQEGLGRNCTVPADGRVGDARDRLRR